MGDQSEPAAANVSAAHDAMPIHVQLDEVAKLPLFDNVEPALVQQLASSFEACQHRAGALLMEAGDLPPLLQVVRRGIVELCRVDDDGHEHGVLLLSEKDLIMPAATLLQEPSLVCARALTTVRIIGISGDLLRAALSQSPQLSFNLLKVTSGQWRMAVRSILELTTRNAAQRLGAFLLRLADLQEGSGPAILPIPKRNLALRLGITPETLSRTLQTVAEHGLHLRGRSILIRDRSKIEDFCGPDPYPVRDERQQHVFAI